MTKEKMLVFDFTYLGSVKSIEAYGAFASGSDAVFFLSIPVNCLLNDYFLCFLVPLSSPFVGFLLSIFVLAPLCDGYTVIFDCQCLNVADVSRKPIKTLK